MAKRTKKLIENNTTDDSIRLNKYLSDAGLCSRREADQYIASGEVTIDGEVAVTGTKITPGQKIVFRGKPVNQNDKLILIAFNKPRGIVCTTDRRDKDNIIDYINYGQRIYPIGRLDKDSEGLILLTNDGNIVNKILRAGNNHEKEYIVEINKPITSQFLKGMAEGVPILDTVTLPCEIKALGKTTFQIILTQGLNRQIRRMCEYYGYKVLSLKRVRIMNVNLGYLQLGGYRNVTDKELGGLKELISESVNMPHSISVVNDEETISARSTSKEVKTSRNLGTFKNKGTRNAGALRKSYTNTNTRNNTFNTKPYSKNTSDLEKSEYTSRTSDTENSKYDAKTASAAKTSYGRRTEKTEKQAYGTRKADSGRPSYGKKFERTEKPDYDTRKADSGKSSYDKKSDRTEKPEYGTKSSYSGKPSYGRKTDRTEKPEKPEYGTKPSYSGKPSYGKKSDRTEKPEYGTKPSYSGKPSYGKKSDRTEKPVYDTKTKGSGKSSFGTKSDDSSKSFKSFSNTKSSNHSRNIDFNKPGDNRRNNGRQANTNQRAGRKTK